MSANDERQLRLSKLLELERQRAELRVSLQELSTKLELLESEIATARQRLGTRQTMQGTIEQLNNVFSDPGVRRLPPVDWDATEDGFFMGTLGEDEKLYVFNYGMEDGKLLWDWRVIGRNCFGGGASTKEEAQALAWLCGVAHLRSIGKLPTGQETKSEEVKP